MTDAQLALIISTVSATVALLSVSWTICWSVWQYRRLHRPRLTVLATDAWPTGPSGIGPSCVNISVVNDGAIAVTLTSLKLVVRKDPKKRGLVPLHWLHFEPQPLPVKLTPGDRWSGLTELQPLVATLVEQFGQRAQYDLWVVVIDAANRQFRTKYSILM